MSKTPATKKHKPKKKVADLSNYRGELKKPIVEPPLPFGLLRDVLAEEAKRRAVQRQIAKLELLFEHFGIDATSKYRWLDLAISLQFLDELWPSDDDTRMALQEFFGLVLTDETRFQKGFIIVGPARSGKGTIARTLRNLLGAKNYCGPNLAQLSKDFGLEPFIGKKIAVIPDARTDSRTNRTAITERLLSVIGEDPQDINRKNAKFWQGILRTRVMILSNELPDFKDDTGVIATRFIILQMHRSFLGHEDTDLEKKLIPELPGILNWAVAGWQRLSERRKFLAPGDGELNDELAGIGSSIRAFVADRCELGVEYQVIRETLYSSYREWCIANGLPYADRLKSNLFSGKLRSAFPGKIDDTRPRKDNPGRKWHYVGIRLRKLQPQIIAAPGLKSLLERKC